MTTSDAITRYEHSVTKGAVSDGRETRGGGGKGVKL